MFSYVSPEERVPPEHPLRPIRVMVDRALAELWPRQLMEQLDYNLLFRWVVGLNADDPVWDATVFTKNRDRLLAGDVAQAFFEAVLSSGRHSEVAKLLLDAGANVDINDRNDISPIAVAAISGRTDLVALFIQYGADVNLRSAGLRPLHFAARDGRAAVARILLANGADPNAETPDGETAAQLAERRDHLEFVRPSKRRLYDRRNYARWDAPGAPIKGAFSPERQYQIRQTTLVARKPKDEQRDYRRS
jgi:ankyrin repeat protein